MSKLVIDWLDKITEQEIEGKKIGQAIVAELLGCSSSLVTQYKQGKANPSPVRMGMLAAIVEILTGQPVFGQLEMEREKYQREKDKREKDERKTDFRGWTDERFDDCKHSYERGIDKHQWRADIEDLIEFINDFRDQHHIQPQRSIRLIENVIRQTRRFKRSITHKPTSILPEHATALLEKVADLFPQYMNYLNQTYAFDNLIHQASEQHAIFNELFFAEYAENNDKKLRYEPFRPEDMLKYDKIRLLMDYYLFDAYVVVGAFKRIRKLLDTAEKKFEKLSQNKWIHELDELEFRQSELLMYALLNKRDKYELLERSVLEHWNTYSTEIFKAAHLSNLGRCRGVLGDTELALDYLDRAEPIITHVEEQVSDVYPYKRTQHLRNRLVVIAYKSPDARTDDEKKQAQVWYEEASKQCAAYGLIRREVEITEYNQVIQEGRDIRSLSKL